MNITFAVNDKYFGNSIEDLELSDRASNCVHRGGIHTIGDLVQALEEGRLSDVRGLGKKVEKEVKNALFNYALCESKDVVKFINNIKVA